MGQPEPRAMAERTKGRRRSPIPRLQIVAQTRRLGVALVEKDYWVTHTLWALHAQGFDMWFKGGTSLSKGFGIVEGFSEDLDLKLEPGRITASPS